ncbi:MAG: hypothetical protein ACLP7P_12255 [Rhodomicrobium sp.]
MFRKIAIVFAACVLNGLPSLASEQMNETGGGALPAMQPETRKTISYAADIRPLFRPIDIAKMKKNGHFDLSSYSDVVTKSIDILGQSQKGDMPCDGAWPQSNADKFKQWKQGRHAALRRVLAIFVHSLSHGGLSCRGIPARRQRRLNPGLLRFTFNGAGC